MLFAAGGTATCGSRDLGRIAGMTADATPQLDLFADSRDVMLCNDAIEALWRRDAAGAVAAQHALAGFAPEHHALAALPVLIDAMVTNGRTPFDAHDELAAARRHLAQRVAPAAQALLAGRAASWLAPLWARLAERAAGLAFRGTHADDHAAPLWLLAREPAAAIDAVQGIESWRRIPVPLGWMVQARHARDGLDAIWPMLVELAWLAPARWAQCCDVLADPLLGRLRRRFEAEYDDATADADADPGATSEPDAPDTQVWFPGWVLNHQPALLPTLRQAQPGQDTVPERVFRVMAELLGLERQGRHAELIEHRKRLRGLQPVLYSIYMRTR